MRLSLDKLAVRLAALFALATIAVGFGHPAIAGPALLFDAGKGTVLYAEDHDDLWYPASLTKMMTAYLTFEALNSLSRSCRTASRRARSACRSAPRWMWNWPCNR